MFDVESLADGTNIIEWMIIINSMTGGMLFTAMIVIGSLITFTISMRSTKVASVATITTGFIWMIISVLLWVIQWNSLTLIPTSLPVIYGIILASGMLMHVVQNR